MSLHPSLFAPLTAAINPSDEAPPAALDLAPSPRPSACAPPIRSSDDIDSLDAAFVPGTGWPEPGGLLPREAHKLVGGVAKEGLCGMELVEVCATAAVLVVVCWTMLISFVCSGGLHHPLVNATRLPPVVFLCLSVFVHADLGLSGCLCESAKGCDGPPEREKVVAEWVCGRLTLVLSPTPL